jgi:pimeloyl-ACP methyl ester carboxylesterase
MKASLLLALALFSAAPAFAADASGAPNRFAATIAPAERFEVGALLVERHGGGGRPLILVPGLSSGAWAMQGLVRAFSGQHAVYVVTLPGFDGRAPITGNVVEATRSALRDLIASRKLDKPVLVGHSLGGTLSFAVAEDHPELVGGIVAIDGLPVMPGTEAVPPPMRAQMAQQMEARLSGDRQAFEAGQRKYMQSVGVLDMEKAGALAELSSRSDPAAVPRIAGEVVALDLRTNLGRITVPVLEVAPFFEPDGQLYGMTEQGKVDYYQTLLAGAPHASVVSIAPSRHFVMFDQPEKLAETIRSFLATLK